MIYRRCVLRCFTPVFLAALCIPELGQARESAVETTPIGTPLLGVDRRIVVRGSLLTGFPDFLGISLALRPLPIPLDLEVGGAGMPFLGAYGYVRLGTSLVLLDHRDTSARGLVLELPVMLGVGYGAFSCCGNESEFQAGDATLGIETYHWLSYRNKQKRLALNFRLIGGAALGRARHTAFEGKPYVESWKQEWLPIVRFSVGIAF